MNKSTKIGMIVGIIVFMVAMVWIFMGGASNDPKQKSRAPFVSSNWTKQYQIDDKNPLGLYLFTALTQSHLDTASRTVVVNDWGELDSITSSVEEPKTYMFVGNDFGMNNNEMDSILDDVANGSRLFLSFDDLTENLYPKLFNTYEFRLEYAPDINVFAGNKKHHMINLFQNDTTARDWWAFGEISFDDEYEGLSSFMEMPNFVKVKHGKGFVYLHTTPNLFYNYQIKRNPGFAYASYVLNQFPRNQDVYLLELGRLTDNYGNYDVDEQEGEGEREDTSYLQLIFRNPPLLAALLLAFLGLLLYIIFRSKRTRPVVPFIPKKKDMTMAFAETITSIYFAKRNPYGLLQVQRKNFYDTVHRYFFVDLYHREGDRELQILSEKSNTPIEEVKYLISAYETKQASAVSEQFVANLAKKKHQFYRRVGIISDSMNQRIQAQEMVFKRSLWLPALMILGGIGLIVTGTYFLMTSVGMGILMWPLGIVLVALGSIRVSRPYLVITDQKITNYSTFGRKREFKRDDLASTDVRKSGAILRFTGNKQLIINYWDLSSFDRKQFERFVSKLHNLEL